MPLKSDKYFTVLELALLLYKQGEFTDSLGLILEAKELKRCDAALYHVGALSSFRLGDLRQTKELIDLSIAEEPDNASHWNLLGEVYRLSGDPIEAIKAFQKALSLDAGIADVYSNLGNVYSDADDFENAFAAYRKALSIDPSHIDALFNLGNVAFRAKRFSVALENYQKVLSTAPHHLGALNNYGLLLVSLKQFDEAERAFKEIQSIRPDFIDGIVSYAKMLGAIRRLDDAKALLLNGLTLIPQERSLQLHLELGAVQQQLGNRHEAYQAFQTALSLDPSSHDARNGVINLEIELKNSQTARARLVAELEKSPNDLALLYAHCFLQLLPIYRNEKEIAEARSAYERSLDDVTKRIASIPQEALSPIVDIIGSSQPFYLPYQGMNDRELQARYGVMISTALNRAMKVAPLPPASARSGRKKRIGFVSGFFRNHSNYKIPLRSWVLNLDKQHFDVYGYYTQLIFDACTQEAERSCFQFRQGPKSLAEWVKIIQQDELDVLIYPELGMDPMSCRLACFRLAPHQATSWGHPTTSGIPTIDYFLSSDLMEPKDAQGFYTEKLIRLPNLSFTYEPPVRERITMRRSDIGVLDDAFVYWCCQSNYKYLPQFDWIFAEIAHQVPTAQFIFIQSEPTSEDALALRYRLDKAFLTKGLVASDFVTYLPGLEPHRFSAAAALCDVALDSFEWSGCNSSFETLAEGTPIITCPGTFMRSRHTEAILRRIGCTETIAKTPEEFVRKAVDLARNRDTLTTLRNRVKSLISSAYNDPETIRGLHDTLITWTS